MPEVAAVVAEPHVAQVAAVDDARARDFGRLNVMMSEMSVLLPDPLDPTSAVVVPAGAWNDTSLSTGTPGLYSNPTSSNRDVALEVRQGGARRVLLVLGRHLLQISRMRSSPANASLICVPMDAICTTGATVMAGEEQVHDEVAERHLARQDRLAADDDHDHADRRRR